MKPRNLFSIQVLLIFVILLTSCGTSAMQTTSSVTTYTTGVNSASSQSAKGLSLSLTLDSTVYRAGQEIRIAIDEKNMLSITNNVPTADKWPLEALSVNPCGTSVFPFGIAIFLGKYSSAEVSKAMPLLIFDPAEPWPCPFQAFKIMSYNFKPSSNIATLFNVSDPNPQTIEMSTTIKATYYWTGHSANSVQHTFDPGVYTVVAGDEWGTLVILHFTVTQ